MIETVTAPVEPAVINRRAKRLITYAVLLSCAAIFVYTIGWGDGSNPLHMAAQSSAFWLTGGILGSLGLAEMVPLLPALWKPTTLPAPAVKPTTPTT